MKKSFILFLIMLAATASIYLLDKSRLRAEDGDGFPDDPDNVELAIPPSSPDAIKYYDGITIISYDPDDDSDPNKAVSGKTEDGKTDKLPGLQPDQIVAVKLQLGANRAGRMFKVAALDGGKLLDADNGYVADGDGNLLLTFQAGHYPGLYQVALNDGTHEIGVQFWVINNEKPEDNPKVDLPEDPIAVISADPETTATPAGNDNPTGPCGQFGPLVTTGCSYDPYTANATRSITDLVVPGAVGMYPLAFTRTLNTRCIVGLQSEFGTAGNWRHSYQWSIDSVKKSGGGFPASYYVNYPDGRRVVFSDRQNNDPYFEGPRGVRDRFQQLTNATPAPGSPFSPSECYLCLPDGGRVHFHATETPIGGGRSEFSFQLVEIIDPYGQAQKISYPLDSAGQCMTIEEPAQRQLKIFYTSVGNTIVVTRVEHWSDRPEELVGLWADVVRAWA